MSADSHVAQARRWLEEQLVALAGLRNAQPRDPGFRNWRQNTLTVLQRIWPDDTQHSERFRRIPFSMPGNKTNPRQAREWYSRGCTEAAKVLRQLLEEVDTAGVPEPSHARDRAMDDPVDVEDDFPTLELPSTGTRPRSAPVADNEENMIDLGGPGLPEGAATGSAADRTPDEPLPPSLQMSRPRLTPPAPRPSAPKAAAPKAPEVPVAKVRPSAATSAKRRAGGKPVRKERSRTTTRGKLKDMLGLARFEATEGSAALEPHEDDEHATMPAAHAPGAPDAPGTGSVDASPPKRRSESQVDLSSLISPEFRDAPAVGPRRTTAKPVAEGAPLPVPPPVEAPLVASTPTAPVTPPVPAGDPSAHEDESLDPEEFARATEDFLRTSPVLGSTGRPVVRASDGPSFMEPDAAGVASLAREIGRLSVPEPQRASLRAHLMDLARQLESGEIEWEALRESVTIAMDHPELARRLMPILLPWFDRAA